ncbi:E3 ligase [Trypanosoma melophagium]|uniref:E3 ligase n=1 Tax=Trypanosoma melophagium TaxID=715481 RepID=UPI00351A92A1|nr:E3 ligase [Trypanosoma melophagium]
MRLPTNSDTRSESTTVSRRKPRGFYHYKFRTRMCRNYTMGLACPFGENCAFSHGDAEPQAARVDEGEMPPPPPYAEAVETELMLPPAYPSRFRHDPYSVHGFMYED